MSLLIFTEKQSARLGYILDFIFQEVLRCEYSMCTDFEFFKNYAGPKINYSAAQPYPSWVNIVPHSLLFDSSDALDVHCIEWNHLPAFLQTSFGAIPFDLFAASFYLVTRYEEYEVNDRDEFGRFPHTKSLAFKNNFLNLPLVDLWLNELKKIIHAHYPDLSFGKKKFQFIPTYDIDIAYSYKHKGLLRNMGGWLSDLLAGNSATRLQVLLNNQKDPYDSYELLDDLHNQYDVAPIYFFLVGRGGKFDKNLKPTNVGFINLIKRIASKYQVGIHPSYRSHYALSDLATEIETLQRIAASPITNGRQHYIKFTLPATYQQLIAEGITDDYSMGYGSINGFRASTSNSFYWFDLSTNQPTHMRIHPFCFMECNAFFEQKQTIVQTEKEIVHYLSQIKKVNGTFISVWHNFSLGTDPLWDGWAALYQFQLRQIKKSLL